MSFCSLKAVARLGFLKLQSLFPEQLFVLPSTPIQRSQHIKMGFFTRFQRNTLANAGTTDTATHHAAGRSSKGPLVMNMSTKPSFGQWLKVTWLDLVTMIIMGVIGLGVSNTILRCQYS